MQRLLASAAVLMLLTGACAPVSRATPASQAITPQSASVSARAPRVGEPAPDFSLADETGRAYRLSDLRGARVILAFLCGCAPCRELAATWERFADSSRQRVVLGISSMSSRHLTEYRRATRVTFPLLRDSGFRVSQIYGSLACPRTWIVGADGVIQYASSPEDTASNVRKAIEHAGEPDELRGEATP